MLMMFAQFERAGFEMSGSLVTVFHIMAKM